MQAWAGFSGEVLRAVVRCNLRASAPWIVCGLLGPMLIALYYLLVTFALREQFPHFIHCAQLLMLWNLVFTVVYVVFTWLRPEMEEAPSELQQTPLPRIQHLLHRMVPQCVVPLTVMLLALPVYVLMLLYFGDPYNSGSQVMDWRWGPNYDWRELANPWGWRVFFAGLNIMAATLLPVSVAVLLRQLVRWSQLRIILLLAIPVLVWFITRRIEFEFFRVCYSQTRGHSPWGYLAMGLALVLLPLLLGWLKPRLALCLLSVLALLTVGLGMLPYIVDKDAGGGEFFRGLRDALGDTRFALAYFFGHLETWLNIELLIERYTSCVLTTDHTAGNLVPQRVALWVGAGLYPIMLALWLVKGYTLGYLLRPRRWRME